LAQYGVFVGLRIQLMYGLVAPRTHRSRRRHAPRLPHFIPTRVGTPVSNLCDLARTERSCRRVRGAGGANLANRRAGHWNHSPVFSAAGPNAGPPTVAFMPTVARRGGLFPGGPGLNAGGPG
jgi:hypothetical protein